MAKIIMRATEITLVNAATNNTKHSDIVINPDTSKYSDMSRLKTYFNKNISQDIMNIAREETQKNISKIKRILNS